MKFPIGAMTFGDVLDRGIKLLLARWPLILGINALCLAPLFVIQLVPPILFSQMENGPIENIAIAGGAVALIGFVLMIILMPVGIAATLQVTINEYLDRPTSFGDAMRTAFSKLGSLILISFLGGIAVALGMMCFCIPGIYIYVSILFATQIIVAEGTTGFDAFSRSNQLVDGHRWRVLGVILVIGVVNAVLAGLISAPFTILQATQHAGQMGGMPDAKLTILANLVQAPFTVVFTAYQAVCSTLMYLDLRIRKEGFDLAVLAQDAARRGESR